MNNHGFIAISTILVISVVVVAIAISVTYLSIGEAQSSLSLVKGEDTLQFVEGCTEDALLKSRNNPSYTGGTITRPEGVCTVSISKNGFIWTMTVSTASSQYRRNIQAIFTRNPTGITLNSWTEI